MSALLALNADVFEGIWKTSCIVAILAALVFVTQGVLGRWLTPRSRYLFSLLIFIRLMLPIAPSSRMSLENLVWPWAQQQAWPVAVPVRGDEKARPGQPVNRPVSAVADESGKPAPGDFGRGATVRASALSARQVIGVVWAGGCLSLAALAGWRYRRWKRLVVRAEAVADPKVLELLENARVTMGVRRPVKLVNMPGLNSPAVFGLRQVWLLLPEGAAARLGDRDLRLILLHEMAHVRRHDLELNVLLMGVQFVHWFNPLVWIANRRIRADGELVCDRLVTDTLLAAERSDYGQLLLKLAGEFQTSGFSGAIPVVGSKREIKRRLLMIKHDRTGSFRAALAAAFSVAALVGATFTHGQNAAKTAPGEGAPPAGVGGSTEGNPGLAGPTTQLGRDLIGTWILVGEPGKIGKPPASGGRYKFYTGSHWCVTQADPDNHVVLFHHGGVYSLTNAAEDIETIQYANPTTIDGIGRICRFQIRIEGDTLTEIGIDNAWREVWKRVGPKSGSIPASSAGQGLIGAWRLSDEPNGYKFITDSSWCDTTADPKTGVVIYHHGGRCRLKGNRYVQSVEYANPSSMNLIGHSFEFDVSVDGDSLRIVGIKNPWTQNWKRAR